MTSAVATTQEITESPLGGATVRLANGTTGAPPAMPPSVGRAPAPGDMEGSDLSREAEEVLAAKRLRVTLTFIASCSSAAILLLVFISGRDNVARTVFASGLTFGIVASLAVLWHLRDLSNYSERLAVALAHVGAIVATSAYYFWGVFSGAIVIAPAAALLTAQSRRKIGTALLAAHFMGSHALLALLQIFGVIQERSVTPMGDWPLGTLIGRLLLIQFMFLAGFALAIKIRRSSDDALKQLDRALREVAQRDALLAEAERNRAEVLAIDVPGRYTDQQIGGYRFGLVIGRGGLGVVYDAVDIETGEASAVKVLHPHVLARPDQFRRFARELVVAAELKHPNLVAVHKAPTDESFPYLAMERLHGENLADHLGLGALEADELADMVEQVASGLEHAHGRGVVHRDIKPQNIFRDSRASHASRWKILDFGACREVCAGSTVTELGHILGTPAYMAPEQARGNRVDARADIYSLAVVAYRSLTGRPAFAGRELPALLQDVAYKMPPQPSLLVAGGTRDLDAFFAIGLAKRPYERFGSATELASALSAALAGELGDDLRERGAALESARPWSAM